MEPQKKHIRIFPIQNGVLSHFKNIGLDYFWRSYGWSKSIDRFLVTLEWKMGIHLDGVNIILGLHIYLLDSFGQSLKFPTRPANTSSFYLQHLLNIISCAIVSELLYILHPVYMLLCIISFISCTNVYVYQKITNERYWPSSTPLQALVLTYTLPLCSKHSNITCDYFACHVTKHWPKQSAWSSHVGQ